MKNTLLLTAITFMGFGAVQILHADSWGTQYKNMTPYKAKFGASFKTHLCKNDYPVVEQNSTSRVYRQGICNLNHVEARVRIPIETHERTTGGAQFKWVQARTWKANIGGFTGLPNKVYTFTVRQMPTDVGNLVFEVVKGDDPQLLVAE